MKLLACLVILLISINSFAQTNSKTVNKNQVDNQMPAEDTDQKLAKDLKKRFPETANITVVWKPVGYGYMAFYTLSNQPKMSLYTADGRYVKSFTSQSWETRVPENVKMEFDNSPYHTYSVITFWESDGSGYKTYFLDMQDREGLTKTAWFDENGKFSDKPM